MEGLVRDIQQTIAEIRQKGHAETHARTGKVVQVFNRRAVNGTVLRLCVPNPDFTQPPVELEAARGITGISQHYKMPGGLPAEHVETYLLSLRQRAEAGEISGEYRDARTRQAFTAICAENPELHRLRFDKDDVNQAYKAARGAISACNIKDIQFFLDIEQGADAYRDPAYRQLREEVGPLTGWTPAKDTLQSIIVKTEQRQQAREHRPR